jgi:hypothetical protein
LYESNSVGFQRIPNGAMSGSMNIEKKLRKTVFKDADKDVMDFYWNTNFRRNFYVRRF